MYSLVLCVHLFLCVFLVTLVLLQQGKGADMGAVMGSGGANSLFGVSGASNVLTRMTTIVAILFMFTSLMLVRFSSGKNARGVAVATPNELAGSVMDGAAQASEAPAAPAGADGASAAAAGVPVPVAAQPNPEIPSAAVSTPVETSDKK
jgi:preprotein translocase subunit SecG